MVALSKPFAAYLLPLIKEKFPDFGTGKSSEARYLLARYCYLLFRSSL